MQTLKSMIVILSLMILSGCSEKIVYLKQPCPTLTPQKDMEHFEVHINNKGGLDHNETVKLINKYKKVLNKFNTCNKSIKRLKEFNKKHKTLIL